MERYAEYEIERFRWLIALLLSFAALAERAISAPEANRLCAMPFLGRAETYAWFLIFRSSGPSQEPSSYPEDREEAARLADSFRAMALALITMAETFIRRCRVAILARRLGLSALTGPALPGISIYPLAHFACNGQIQTTGPPSFA